MPFYKDTIIAKICLVKFFIVFSLATQVFLLYIRLKKAVIR
jgi:hypothetical protein